MVVRGAARERDRYAESAPAYDALHREEQERKVRLIIHHLPFSPGDKLLDVGCGTGFSLSLWPVREAWGAEPSAAMIRQAPLPLRSRILQVRAEDLSVFRDGEFDVVVSVTAIHHFADLGAGLLEMRRVGKRKFAFSVLKRSARLGEIDRLIRRLFRVRRVVEERHDRLYLIW